MQICIGGIVLKSELLHMIADKLGKTNRELIEEFQINVY